MRGLALARDLRLCALMNLAGSNEDMPLETMVQAQRRLAGAGYEEDLVADRRGLRVTATGAVHAIEDVVVAELVRFEGDSDPDDEAILFAVATVDGRPLGTYTVPYGPDADPVDVAVLLALHGAPASAEEVAAHDEHDHVAAVFHSKAEAEAAVEELRQLGFGSDRMGVAAHHGDRYVFERDVEAEIERDAVARALQGIPIGAVAGMALAAVAFPGIGTLGVGGLLAVGGASGIGGGMLGGYLGVAQDSTAFDEHERLGDVALAPGEVLVAVCSHQEPTTITNIFQRHGGRLVRDG